MRYLPFLFLASCTSPSVFDDPPGEREGGMHFIQGFAGVSDLGTVGGSGPADGGFLSGADVDAVPFLGGALQFGLTNVREVEVGIEGGATFFAGSFDGSINLGGTPQATDADLFGGSFFLGAFASYFWSSNWRIWAGAGPLFQLVRFDFDFDAGGLGGDSFGDNASGFGYYVRAGIERRLADGFLLGIGARWFDADLDFSDDFEGEDFSGPQLFVTLSYAL